MIDPLYNLLRHLTSPIVAITTSAGGRRNGMIANSAQRASLVPSLPRVSVYISKTNFSHDLVYSSGLLGLHLLRGDQYDVIAQLGLSSGRDGDKLGKIELREGITGCPLLVDCRAAFECRVVNAMDAGAATFFLADIVGVEEPAPDAPVMTSDIFRSDMPADLRAIYEARLIAAQQELTPLAGNVARENTWPGPTAMA